jgi:hypothetical protein
MREVATEYTARKSGRVSKGVKSPAYFRAIAAMTKAGVK